MPLSNDDRDAAIRTIIGEAGNQSPEGQAAVAHVLFNRLNSGNYGATMRGVVLAPGQFDSWHQQNLTAINPRSQQYQQVGQMVDQVQSQPDFTGGATHFLNPSLVKKMPNWTQGNSLTIGDHNFYAPDNPNYNGSLAAIRAAINPQSQSATDPMAAIKTAINSTDIPN